MSVHQLVPLFVEDVGAGLVFDAAGGQVLGHGGHPRGDAAVPLPELDLAGRLEDQRPPGPVGVHPDGDAPQYMPGVGCVQPLLAGDAVQHAEDDGIRPHKGRDVPDGRVQPGGLDGDQDQVRRPAVGRRAAGKAARLPVAEGRLGGIAGGAVRIGDHLHPRHLPPEQDAQRAQPDQRARADGPDPAQAAALPEDGVPFLDALGGKIGVRHQNGGRPLRPFRAGQALQGHPAADRLALRQLFAAVVVLVDPAHFVQFHPAASISSVLDKVLDVFIIPARPCPVNVSRSQNPLFQ